MNRTRMAILGLVALLTLLLVGGVWAQSSAHYAIDWHVMSEGGAPAASDPGAVTLNCSLGQTAIGASTSSSGDYTLKAGYWYGAAGGERYIYLPIVLRGT